MRAALVTGGITSRHQLSARLTSLAVSEHVPFMPLIRTALRALRNRVRAAIEKRRYHFTYSQAFYEEGYHDKLHDGGADDLSAWEARGYKQRLYNVLDWVDRIVPNAFFGRHLEVACMYGKTAFWLAERYPALTIDAFDFSHRFVEIARQHNPFSERIHIWQDDATELHREDAQYDSVTCIDVTEHLPDVVYQATLRELARVTKTGGHVLVMQGNTPQVEHIHILPEDNLVADFVAAGFVHVGTHPVPSSPGNHDYFHLFRRQT